MKRYQLQQYQWYDAHTRTEYWKIVRESDDLETLKLFCPSGYRIIDNHNRGKVVYQPNI